MINKYHKSCATLPIYNFYQVIDKGDYSYLVRGYVDGDEVNVDDIVASKLFKEIVQEYSELTSNKEILISLKLRILIAGYEYERDLLKSILTIYEETKQEEVLSLLSEFNFDPSRAESVDTLLKSVISRVKSLNNNIRVQKNKYTTRFKKETQEVKRNLDKQALSLEMNLKLGREINVHKTSVTKWVNMFDIAREKSKELEKLRSK